MQKIMYIQVSESSSSVHVHLVFNGRSWYISLITVFLVHWVKILQGGILHLWKTEYNYTITLAWKSLMTCRDAVLLHLLTCIKYHLQKVDHVINQVRTWHWCANTLIRFRQWVLVLFSLVLVLVSSLELKKQLTSALSNSNILWFFN